MQTKKLTLGGILAAIGLICIYAANLLPTNKLIFMAICTSIIILSISINGVKWSLISYGVTSVLALLIVGIRGTVIMYISFFGIYGFIKYYIERINKVYLEILLKLIFFNICVFINFVLYKVLLLPINMKYPIHYILIASQFIFIIFDYALTLLITYLSRKLINKLK